MHVRWEYKIVFAALFCLVKMDYLEIQKFFDLGGPKAVIFILNY